MFIAIILLLLFIINNREKIAQVLQPFVFGVVIAYILNPVVEILTENKMHRTAAVALIYFILIGSMIIALVYILPVIMIELNNLMVRILIYRFTENIQKLYVPN